MGKVSQFKYVDYDITETTKFPKLSLSKYLELKIDLLMNQTIPMSNGMKKPTDGLE
jgi:hypothetical protein